MTIRLETLAIGDELLTGKISDTNSTFVASRLFSRGMRLDRQTVVADDEPAMLSEIDRLSREANLAVCFGGLGPTSDDKTVDCLARRLGCEPRESSTARSRMEARYRELGRPVTPQAIRQVRYPAAAEPLENPVGLAPGFAVTIGLCRFFFLPGVPEEMRAIFDASVLPEIEARAGMSERVLGHVWRCLGIPESEVQRRLDPVEAALPKNAWIGYRTIYPENHVTLYWRAEAGEKDIPSEWIGRVRERLGEWTYTETSESLEAAVGDALRRASRRVALAESCTGGLTAQRLTRVPGASAYVWGGVTCYQVAAKERLLGVKLSRPEDAVSAECTRRLAQSVRETSGCDIGAAVTGYVGPEGGTESDPVGTVYLAVSTKSGIEEKRVMLPRRDREQRQWGASSHLLEMILRAASRK